MTASISSARVTRPALLANTGSSAKSTLSIARMSRLNIASPFPAMTIFSPSPAV